MEQVRKPPVWQKVREAVKALGGKTTNKAVVALILNHYPGTNVNTIRQQIIFCTVNHSTRIHYPGNKKPRVANTRYDFLFRPEPGSGQIELYEPEKHGKWEIHKGINGSLGVRQVYFYSIQDAIEV